MHGKTILLLFAQLFTTFSVTTDVAKLLKLTSQLATIFLELLLHGGTDEMACLWIFMLDYHILILYTVGLAAEQISNALSKMSQNEIQQFLHQGFYIQCYVVLLGYGGLRNFIRKFGVADKWLYCYLQLLLRVENKNTILYYQDTITVAYFCTTDDTVDMYNYTIGVLHLTWTAADVIIQSFMPVVELKNGKKTAAGATPSNWPLCNLVPDQDKISHRILCNAVQLLTKLPKPAQESTTGNDDPIRLLAIKYYNKRIMLVKRIRKVAQLKQWHELMSLCTSKIKDMKCSAAAACGAQGGPSTSAAALCM